MAVLDRPEPADPGPGEVVVAPEAIGICGSDYHFFTGELSDAAGGSQFPRVQGHEVGGHGSRPSVPTAAHGWRSANGSRCGRCTRAAIATRAASAAATRATTSADRDPLGRRPAGAAADRRQDQVFPIEADDPAVAAMAEPVSIAVRAVKRGRIQAGERVVVLGAGPIGQCVCLVARERGAEVLVVDLQERRLALSREIGAETLVWTTADEVVAPRARWAGPAGPPVAVDATGAPAAVRAMIDMVASAGRAVQVGMSRHEVAVRIGSLTEKELDVLGVSCCGAGDFAEAVGVVERNGELIGR